MSGSTTELALKTAVDSDDTADYLTLSLADSLRTVDALFNNVTGHNHGGAHQGGSVTPAPGSITGGMIQDGSITGADLADATITNAKLGPDVARANMLTNGGFEVWQRGMGPFTAGWTSDRWSINLAAGDTMSASASGQLADLDVGSQFCLAAQYNRSTGGSNIEQNIAEMLPRLRGRTISLSARVKCSTANAVRLRIYDGSANFSAYHTGGGTYETLTITRALAANPASLLIGFMFDATCTAYLDNACLVVGSQPANYVPLHPADDWMRCQRYYERTWDQASGNNDMGIVGQVWAANTGSLPLLYTQKAVVPTISSSAPSTFQLLTANFGASTSGTSLTTGGQIGTKGARITLTCGTANLVIGNACTLQVQAGAYVSIEANP